MPDAGGEGGVKSKRFNMATARTQYLTCFVVRLTAVLLIFLAGGCSPSEMTMGEAKRMLDQAGGIEKVNAEARTVFDKYGQAGTTMLGNDDLLAFPAIRSLGNAFIEHLLHPIAIVVNVASGHVTNNLFACYWSSAQGSCCHPTRHQHVLRYAGSARLTGKSGGCGA